MGPPKLAQCHVYRGASPMQSSMARKTFISNQDRAREALTAMHHAMPNRMNARDGAHGTDA